MRFIAVFLCCLTATCSISQAATSIVGQWDFREERCQLPLRISAMSMVHADVNCKFRTVQRRGDTVTWHGTCKGDEGSSQEIVTARLDKMGRLTISFVRGGNVLKNLTRCK